MVIAQTATWKRVARSSLATEGMAVCEATEHGDHYRACLAEVIIPSFSSSMGGGRSINKTNRMY